MNDALYRLVYVSRNRIEADGPALLQEIGGILDKSRSRNAEDGITGALMYNDGCFAQVLEGEHDALQETFERIQCDERHDEVCLLGLERVEARGFGNWSMAYVGQDEASRRSFAALSVDGGLDPDALPPGRIFALLREHLADAERAARQLAA